MTVWFIGAGPGDPDLLTIKARDLIARCPVCLYAGSLVPPAVVAHAPAGARVIDTASLDLGAIMAEIVAAHRAGHDVARVHSGDPSLYGAIGEQITELRRLDIPWQIVPGVPAFAAVAATLGVELTLPEIAQTVILTRVATRASSMPEHEDLGLLAQSRATLALHLSVKALPRIVATLAPLYGADCPAAVVARASWPDEQVIRGTLADIADRTVAAGIERTALVVVGRVLDGELRRTSALYASDHARHLKP